MPPGEPPPFASPLVAGVDVGSVATKAVIYAPEHNTVAAMAVIPTGWNSRAAGEEALRRALRAVGDIQPHKVVATGYGRVALPFADKVVTEITCHARGAVHVFPGTRVVLDIGGQDSKVIGVEADGRVQEFVMNDKCAAGTGRFLQVLSGILGMELDALGQAAATGTPASISSMCAVFAETEIIGLLAQGTPPADVAAGVFAAIARRMAALASRVPPRGEYTFTGGLATCPSFATALGAALKRPINVPASPQTVGALGAALIAADTLNPSRQEMP